MRDTTGLTPGSHGKPTGTPRAHPTPAQVDRYRRQLHAQAQAGDVLALGFVVLCDTLKAIGEGKA